MCSRQLEQVYFEGLRELRRLYPRGMHNYHHCIRGGCNYTSIPVEERAANDRAHTLVVLYEQLCHVYLTAIYHSRLAGDMSGVYNAPRGEYALMQPEGFPAWSPICPRKWEDEIGSLCAVVGTAPTVPGDRLW